MPDGLAGGCKEVAPGGAYGDSGQAEEQRHCESR